MLAFYTKGGRIYTVYPSKKSYDTRMVVPPPITAKKAPQRPIKAPPTPLMLKNTIDVTTKNKTQNGKNTGATISIYDMALKELEWIRQSMPYFENAYTAPLLEIRKNILAIQEVHTITDIQKINLKELIHHINDLLTKLKGIQDAAQKQYDEKMGTTLERMSSNELFKKVGEHVARMLGFSMKYTDIFTTMRSQLQKRIIKQKDGSNRMTRRTNKKSNGGGWSINPADYISAGNPVNQRYAGVGMDCAGSPVRPGFMTSHSSMGLPGLSGGKRSKRSYKLKRGGTQLSVASQQNFDTVVSAPSVPPHAATAATQSKQAGGRYEVSPGFLDSNQAIGASSYAPVSSIPCERGYANPLNQHMSGGAQLTGAPIVGESAHFPVVHVGQASAMAYNAPTAGYRNDFQAMPGTSAVGGLMLQTPYDARSFNQACLKTGGSRRKRRQGGANGVAHMAESYAPLSLSQVMTREAFDGTTGGLPVKFGGKRRKHSKRHSKRRSTRRTTRKHTHRRV